jgi:hypothetical protein
MSAFRGPADDLEVVKRMLTSPSKSTSAFRGPADDLEDAKRMLTSPSRFASAFHGTADDLEDVKRMLTSPSRFYHVSFPWDRRRSGRCQAHDDQSCEVHVTTSAFRGTITRRLQAHADQFHMRRPSGNCHPTTPP